MEVKWFASSLFGLFELSGWDVSPKITWDTNRNYIEVKSIDYGCTIYQNKIITTWLYVIYQMLRDLIE